MLTGFASEIKLTLYPEKQIEVNQNLRHLQKHIHKLSSQKYHLMLQNKIITLWLANDRKKGKKKKNIYIIKKTKIEHAHQPKSLICE